MPRYARKTRKPKTYRKRRTVRKKRGSSRSFTVKNTTGNTPLPTRYRCKLNYANYGGSITANADANQFRINSVFDPDATYTGHQPLGFDQLSTFYNRYIVTRCDVTSVYTLNSSSNSSILVTLIANNASTDFTLSSTMAPMEQPFAKNLFLNQEKRSARHKASYWPHRITGVDWKTYMADDRFQSATSTNPGEIIHLHQVISLVTGGATAIASEVLINQKFTYHVDFYDPIPISQS